MKTNRVMVPVELCQLALSQKIIRPFQVYILLKLRSSGILKIDSHVLKSIRELLGLKTTRTIRNNINKLKELDWIGYNKASSFYFIRSFRDLLQMYNCRKTRFVEVKVEGIKDLKYISYAVLVRCLNVAARKREKMRVGELRIKGSSIRPAPHFSPIANKATAKILNIVASTASKYKTIAATKGLILIQKNVIPQNNLINHIHRVREANPEIAHKIRKSKGKVVIQGTDHLSSTVRVLRRKKNESYRKGI